MILADALGSHTHARRASDSRSMDMETFLRWAFPHPRRPDCVFDASFRPNTPPDAASETDDPRPRLPLPPPPSTQRPRTPRVLPALRRAGRGDRGRLPANARSTIFSRRSAWTATPGASTRRRADFLPLTKTRAPIHSRSLPPIPVTSASPSSRASSATRENSKTPSSPAAAAAPPRAPPRRLPAAFRAVARKRKNARRTPRSPPRTPPRPSAPPWPPRAPRRRRRPPRSSTHHHHHHHTLRLRREPSRRRLRRRTRDHRGQPPVAATSSPSSVSRRRPSTSMGRWTGPRTPCRAWVRWRCARR